ncbi:ion channel [Ramlibacter albus]|uniref:Two pore domain potassium channel family protein n=1 Tax=Ramlibacter albus TaxID=2079448 RepID=A0A923MD78_9BURK|nr:ion channel [Ramlibacter albus]MBC5768597.1 two pore domain potassium channel family protein [Ramlibacter albus]
MSMMAIAEAIAGVVLAALALRDVFDTVVVPGRSRGLLRIAGRLVLGSVELLHSRRRKPVGLGFAPFMLLVTFIVWLLLLVLAFGLLAHAAGDSFDPPLQDFGDALYVAGGSMTTLGFSPTEASGAGSVIAVAAGFCGLAVMTMAVTYLLEVQANIATRDTLVLKMATAAGQPPSALGLLELLAATGGRAELRRELQEGRDWCAAILQSHASHPSVIYFRSVGTATGWPATLGALLDLALIAQLLLDEDETCAPAVLLRKQANRLAKDVTKLLELDVHTGATAREEAREVCRRLVAAGYRVRADADLDAFGDARAREVAAIDAMALHLGTAKTPLLGAPPVGETIER